MRTLTNARALSACSTLLAARLPALAPSTAGAASPPITRQAQTANAAFLAYAPAPPAAKALCLGSMESSCGKPG
jgi:hypothetical protein